MQRRALSKSTPEATTPEKHKNTSWFANFINFLLEHKGFILIFLLVISGGIFLMTLAQHQKTKAQLRDLTLPDDCNDFVRIKGSYPNSTTVILGELHYKHASTLKCADAILKDKKIKKHTFVLEGIPYGEVDCEEADIEPKPARTCFGWDDHAHYVETYKLQAKNHELKMLEEYFSKQQPAPEKMDKIIALAVQDYLLKHGQRLKDQTTVLKVNELSLMPYSKKKLEKLREQVRYETRVFIQIARQQGKTYNEIFKSIPQNLPDSYVPEEHSLKNSMTRNNGLIKALAEGPGTFKIGITGLAHANQMLRNKEWVESVAYVENELEKRKDENPYAILAMYNPK